MYIYIYVQLKILVRPYVNKVSYNSTQGLIRTKLTRKALDH